HARELAGDSEPKPRASETLCSRGIGLGELLEQLGLLLRGNADPGVGHGKLDPVASACHPARPQRDLALLGELTSIAQQIEQYLPQPHWIDGEGAKVLLRFDQQAVLVLLGELSGGADDLVDQRCQLHGLWVELELSGLDLR